MPRTKTLWVILGAALTLGFGLRFAFVLYFGLGFGLRFAMHILSMLPIIFFGFNALFLALPLALPLALLLAFAFAARPLPSALAALTASIGCRGRAPQAGHLG